MPAVLSSGSLHRACSTGARTADTISARFDAPAMALTYACCAAFSLRFRRRSCMASNSRDTAS